MSRLPALSPGMFSAAILDAARDLVTAATGLQLRIVTAESCTGGLIAGALTAVPGSSNVLERGYVTYSNRAKSEALGVPEALLASYGAVSREVAIAMAEGALRAAPVDLSVAVTGVAGPGGGSSAKPVGLVHLAALRRGRPAHHEERRFGDIGRDRVREETVLAALRMLRELID